MSSSQEEYQYIQTETQSLAPTTPFWKKRVFIISAVFVVLVCISTLLYFFLVPREQPQETNFNNASTEPEKALTTLASQLEDAGSFSFQRIAGQEQGFVRGVGTVVLPNKFQEVKYGSPYDIWWIKQKSSPDMTLSDYFSEDSFEYLGGFGDYAAFQEKRYKKMFYFETAGVLDERLLYRILQVPNDVNMSSKARENIGVWNNKPVDTVYSEEDITSLWVPVLEIHIPEILLSHTFSSEIHVATTTDLALITYSVDSSVFTFSQSFLGDLNDGIAKYEITVAVLPDGSLQYVDVEVRVERMNSDMGVVTRLPQYASRIYITSMEIDSLPEPQDGDREPSIDIAEIHLPVIQPLNVQPRQEVVVLELPALPTELSEPDQPFFMDDVSGQILFSSDVELQVRVYNADGDFTGIIQPPFEALSGFPQENVGTMESFGSRNYYHFSLGDLETDHDDYYLIELRGTQDGLFSFEFDGISEMFIPTTPLSRGTMTIVETESGTIDFNRLHYDVDGDGVTDFEISHSFVWMHDGTFTPEAQELFNAMYEKIESSRVQLETTLE